MAPHLLSIAKDVKLVLFLHFSHRVGKCDDLEERKGHKRMPAVYKNTIADYPHCFESKIAFFLHVS